MQGPLWIEAALDDLKYHPSRDDCTRTSDLLDPAFWDIVVRIASTTVEPSSEDPQVFSHQVQVLNGVRHADQVPRIVAEVSQLRPANVDHLLDISSKGLTARSWFSAPFAVGITVIGA